MRKFIADDLERAAERVKVQISVFLAGPFVNPEIARPTEGANLEAKIARHFLYHQIRRHFNVECVMGEHTDLQRLYGLHLRKWSNAALAEVAHISDKLDCVIILPSSPGSFSELGHFAAHPKICRKMLLLMDVDWRDPPGYVHLGPAKMAEAHGSKVDYVKYSDHDIMWKISFDFLEDMRAHKMAQKYMVSE